MSANPDDVERRFAELEARVERLEAEAWRKAFPFLPANPSQPVASDRCHVCGVSWENMTHYVCANPACPNRVTCTCDASRPSHGGNKP